MILIFVEPDVVLLQVEASSTIQTLPSETSDLAVRHDFIGPGILIV